MTYRSQVAQFTIEDTGIGIHPDDLQRIFQPFERSRTSRDRKMTGTGLGLTITKLLTEIMGGQITVKSNVGKGSTFQVKLLLSEAANPRTAPVQEDRVVGYVGAPQTILVVDDDDDHRKLVREMLEPLGFRIFTASSGQECLALTEQHKPQLILLDVGMPEMDGWEVGRQLRRIPRDRPAIIMLSAFAPDPKQKTQHDPVHDDYLIKPFDLRQLLAKIHALLDIEWAYGEDVLGAAQLLAPVAIPPHLDVDELIRLGQIGYVRAIQEKLAEIEMRSEAHRDFSAYLKVFVDGFDLKRYVAALELLRDVHG